MSSNSLQPPNAQILWNFGTDVERLEQLTKMAGTLRDFLQELEAEIDQLSGQTSRQSTSMGPLEVAEMILRIRGGMREAIDGRLIHAPGFDVLLDMIVSQAGQRRVSISGASVGSGVAPTTSLRWITRFCECGIARRTDDPNDQRRSWVQLTDRAFHKLSSVLLRR